MSYDPGSIKDLSALSKKLINLLLPKFDLLTGEYPFKTTKSFFLYVSP